MSFPSPYVDRPDDDHDPAAPATFVDNDGLDVRSEARHIVELRRRRDGWTALRQRTFLAALANSGSVVAAAEAADITPRSAYRLRNHPLGAPFRAAWDAALLTASHRLLGVAFERALTGTPRRVWRGNRIVADTQVPSDAMLMFLLRHLDPTLFAADGDAAARADAVAARAAAYPAAMAALEDCAVEADILDVDDWRPHRPPEEAA